MAERTAVATAPGRAEPSPGTPRVLLVEDDATLLGVLQRLLGDHWTVDARLDASSALEAARAHPPDLVLTDLVLPGLDGLGFVRALRSAVPTHAVPILVISGLTEEADRVRALEAGANDYLIKPFSEKELLLRVGTHLEMASLRREAARLEGAAQVRSILEAALDAVVVTDAAGRVTGWNAQAEATFGWSREEALGRPVSELIVPPERRRLGDGLETFFETDTEGMPNRRAEVEALRRDGTRLPLELTVTRLEGWGAPSFTAFCRDISERRRADEERNRLLEEARQAARLKDEFLAMLSHELRTPLSAIVGWAHMLRTGDLDPATTSRAIETIERNARLQNQLIEDILDVSRIIAGKFHLDMRSADLARVVEAAAETVGLSAKAKGVALELELDRGVGPAVGDPERLQQVVWNLLSNAIKFTPHGGRVTVTLACRQDTGEFEIQVRDTGSGIDPEFLPHVFERFRQAGSGAKRSGGLGLGLSIVRHIVETHGGTVAVDSGGPGRGTTFMVRLPVVDAAAESQRLAPVSPVEAGMEEAPRLDGLRVLVVEDEPDARQLIAAVLQRRGAGVFLAASGREGLETLQRERPDVVLSDIAMRSEDGYDFIRRVRALPPEGGGRTPAAALTGYGRLEDRMRALSAGFQLHAAKPVEPAELVAVVASLAGRT